MSITQTFAAKLAVAFVAIAMMLSVVAPAQAQTAEELQAQIAQLMATIAALQGGASTPAAGVCPYTWTRSLTTGSTGADVMTLQKFLNADAETRVAVSGAGSAGMETSYFGPATAAAVSKFQVKYRADILTPSGLVNPTGYFGPSSMAKANALCATGTPTTPGTPGTPTGPLSGGEGYVEFDVLLDSDVAIDLGDSETVIEVELEAKDSDIAVNRVDFMFDSRPWLYFSEVNLLVDGREVGSLTRSSDFTEVGSDWRARFTGADIVIREDDTAELALELVVLASMAGTRDQDTPNVWLPQDGIRFVDGAGLTDYEPGSDEAMVEVSFDDTFGEGDISLTLSSDSPKAATIVLNESSRTSGVEVAIWEVEAEDSDIEVTDVYLELDNASTSAVSSVVYRARLLVDGQVVSTKSGSTSVHFNNLKNIMIDEDDTAEFSVEIDFNRGDQVAPDTLTIVEVTVEGENADFDPVTDTLAIGEDHTLIVEGIVVDNASFNTTLQTFDTPDNNYGEFRVTFDVTAVGDTVYVPLTATRATTTSHGASFIMESSDGSVASAGTTTQSLTRKSGGSQSAGWVRINDGQTVTFELYVTYNPATTGQYRIQLDNVAFDDAQGGPVSDSAPASPAEDFESGNILIAS